jgi:hypothetical protein
LLRPFVIFPKLAEKAFPEFSKSDLYLTGESYFGQYGPNIAHFIVNNAPFDTSLNLKGLALGNACWGGDATSVVCNGPNSEQNDVGCVSQTVSIPSTNQCCDSQVDMFWGKGLVSKKLYKQVQGACKWPDTSDPSCDKLLEQVHHEIGPHNIYNM